MHCSVVVDVVAVIPSLSSLPSQSESLSTALSTPPFACFAPLKKNQCSTGRKKLEETCHHNIWISLFEIREAVAVAERK
jgi:hypothetical protein